jgi:hypothetical protein
MSSMRESLTIEIAGYFFIFRAFRSSLPNVEKVRCMVLMRML